MWLVGRSEGVDVYLGTRGVAVCDGKAPAFVADVQGVAAAFDRLANALRDAPPSRRGLRFWLSGGLCRPFSMPDVPGASTDADRQSVAAAMAPQMTGLIGPCTVFLERNAMVKSSLGVAVQTELIAKIHESIMSLPARFSVISIKPWWAEVLRFSVKRAPDLAALGVQDCDSITVLVGRTPDGFDIASTYSPVVDQHTAKSVLARAMLSADVTANDELVGCLDLNLQLSASETNGFALSCFTRFSR